MTVKFLIRAEASRPDGGSGCSLISRDMMEEIAARCVMGKYPVIRHPSSIQPELGGCLNCPLISEYFEFITYLQIFQYKF